LAGKSKRGPGMIHNNTYPKLKRTKEHTFFVENTPNAGELMEKFIESGAYKQLKELVNKNDAINKTIYNHLIYHEAKRHEIGYHLVAKFIPKKIFKYDYPALNDFLNDRGLLQNLTKLTSKDLNKNPNLIDLFEPYRLSSEFYIKPSFNNLGKEFVKIAKSEDLPIPLEEAVRQKRDYMDRSKTAKLEYDLLKKQMRNCQYLNMVRKIPHKYGSVSLIQKPFTYDSQKITDDLLINTLIEFGKPDLEGLLLYVTKGFLSLREIESFRTLVDIQLDFAIFDINDEAKMMNYFYQKVLSRAMI
jgi:hypothetical protein